MDVKNIINYYDNYILEHQKSGINDRIHDLYVRLKKYGLVSESNVLELGSGIGTLTYLLSKTVRKGQIEAVDISPKSIEFAQQRIKKPNIKFIANDIVTYASFLQKIDFITLFDVIEHIPVERHNELFQNISRICEEGTKILINIPNPEYLKYDIENNPETLQIVDQPLPLNLILRNLEINNLNIDFFETYSVWVKNDYQFFLVTKKRVFREIKLSDKRNFFQKAIKKIERTYLRMRYNYR